MTTAVRLPVTDYAEAVLAGDLIAGNLVRLACERHKRDMETGHLRGLRFDDRKAEEALKFFNILRLPDGANAGERFELLPWQQFVVGSLFGWYGPDGRRRFHYALVEVARANGKSPLAAGIGLFGLTADKEQGAQIYSAATTRDQAKIVFNDAYHMAEKSPSLWPQLTKTVNNLAFMRLSSFFRPLAAEASKMDGLRVHIALVDELHEHPNGQVLAKLRTGMKSTQPLLFMITTAGHDRHSVCYDEHDHGVKVLEGVIENDAYFAFIATLDDDDWQDEECWAKANPSLGLTVRIETLREECELAKQIPSQENDFKRLRLNVWTEQATRWLSTEMWDAGKADPEALTARPCYAGIVSSEDDLTAVALWYPDDEGGGDVVISFFMPEDNLAERSRQSGVPLDRWAADGWIEATEGNVTDYDLLRKRLNAFGTVYDIKEVAVRKYNTTQLETQLMGDGFEVVEINRGFPGMSAATKEVERLLTARKLRHGGHPVLRWMASNIAVRTDADGEKRPDRENSGGSICGLEALIIALARAMVQPEAKRSIYETRGSIVL